MNTVLYIFSIVSALGVLAVVFESLRRQRLRERHALWWILAGCAALLISVFPNTLDVAAGFLGIDVPANLVFFVSIAVLFLVCIQIGSELTDLERKTRRLAEAIALLEERLRRVEGPSVDSDVEESPRSM